jgi:hypothetical protein
LLVAKSDRIIRLAAENRLPAIYSTSEDASAAADGLWRERR